jgi:hypothetical protein
MIRQALFSADSGPEVPWYWRERPVLLLFTILFGVMMVGGAAADVPTWTVVACSVGAIASGSVAWLAARAASRLIIDNRRAQEIRAPAGGGEIVLLFQAAVVLGKFSLLCVALGGATGVFLAVSTLCAMVLK